MRTLLVYDFSATYYYLQLHLYSTDDLRSLIPKPATLPVLRKVYFSRALISSAEMANLWSAMARGSLPHRVDVLFPKYYKILSCLMA